MLTKIVVEKTYWVGMTETQRAALTAFFKREELKPLINTLTTTEAEAISDLRQALLNA